MKILVISLLRLGDIIMQKPLLLALLDKYPHAQIDVLINDEFMQVQSLFAHPRISFVAFPRKSIQANTLDLSANIFKSFEQLSQLVNTLNENKYDQLFNFSNTKISTYVATLIDSPVKKGLYFSGSQLIGLDNGWIGYLNESTSQTFHSLFHINELLAYAFDLEISKYSAVQRTNKKIAIQCLTSDNKKNWSLNKFKALFDNLKLNHPDYEIKVIAAQNELPTLNRFFSNDNIYSCSLIEAQEFLKTCDLLVASDTSIKHLAAEAGCAIVEISLGSSNPQKTGAFSSRTFVTANSATCYPCGHKQACHQPKHICSESTSVDAVIKLVEQVLRSNTSSSESYAERLFFRNVWQKTLGLQASLVFNNFNLEALLADLNSLRDVFKIIDSTNDLKVIYEAITAKKTVDADKGYFFQKLKNCLTDKYVSHESAQLAFSYSLELAKKLITHSFQTIEQLKTKGEHGPVIPS